MKIAALSAIAFAPAALVPAAQAYTLFGLDLKTPIFPQNGTLKVYKAKNDKLPLAEFKNLTYYAVGTGGFAPASATAKMAGCDAISKERRGKIYRHEMSWHATAFSQMNYYQNNMLVKPITMISSEI
ncbi:hypothetical protein [Pseudoduganella sp. HUAS MS19]